MNLKNEIKGQKNTLDLKKKPTWHKKTNLFLK